MDLPNKSDSQAPKPERRKLEPVIPGAMAVPRPATRRFMDYVFAESPKALGRKIGRDIIVPRIKAGFEEAANNFLSGMLWGAGGSRPMSNIVQGTVLRGGASMYTQASQAPSALAQARSATNTRSSGNYEDLICPTQEHAEMLLANLYKVLNEYRVVSVADLYEMANMTPKPSDSAYGWMTLDAARISKVRDGFLLELPRPSLI